MPDLSSLSSRRVLGLTVREHIGGRWAIPWLVAILGFPLNIAATVATNFGQGSGATLREWVVVSLIGYFVMLGVLGLAKISVLRSSGAAPVPIWLVGIVGSAAGVIRVLVMDATLQAFDLATLAPSTLVVRSFASALIGFIVLPLGAFVTSTVYQFRTQRRALINDRVAWHRAQMRTEGATAELRSALLEQVEVDLNTAIEQLGRGSDQVHVTLQRTGRELWEGESERRGGEFQWRQVLAAGLRTNPLPTGFVLAIWAPTAVSNFAGHQAWWVTLTRVVMSCLAIALVFHLGHRWISRRGHPSMGVLVAVLVGSWILTSPVSWWLFASESLSKAAPTMIVNAAWLAIVTVFCGAAIGAVRSSENVLEDLRRRVSEAEIQALAADEELVLARRELGEKLHGPVRSRLNAASAVLQGLVGAEPKHVEGVLQDAMNSLSLESGSTDSAGDLRGEIERVLEPWHPLIDLVVECPPVRSERAHAAAVLTEEAVANAYRHGRATQVQVGVDIDEASLRINIVDNGTGLKPGAEPGLGTRLLDHHAPGAWTRESGRRCGAVVRIVLPGRT